MPQTPPLSTKPLHFHMPPVGVLTLDDGTPLYVIPREGQDLVTITVHLRSGAAHDTDRGASAFAAELLTRGTERLTAEEFDELVEFRGCTIRASSDRNNVSVQGFGLAEHLEHMVALIAECLSTPRFDQRELDLTRSRWITELGIDTRDPDWLAGQASNRVCYAGHPYVFPRRGELADMQGMTRDKVVAAHQRLVRSDRVVIIAGPVQVEDMPAKLKPLASGLPAPSFNNWLPQAHARERAAVVGANAEAVQTAFRISLPCVAYDHPDFSAVQLVTNLLGGFSLARLFSILREEKGYTYGAYAQPSVRPHAQTIDLVTSVGNEHTADTVRILAEQVQRMGSELIPADELEDARQQLLGSFARTNETPQQTASLVWQTIQHGLPLDYFERHVSRLQSYRPEELLSVQQRYFDVNRWAVGCSGLPEVLQPALEPYVDSIEIWDASDQDAGDQETGDPETGEAANDA